MTTQIFDDGSTLTYDYSGGGNSVTSTPATDSFTSSSSAFPGSGELMNALTYGFGRWVDYRTRPQQPTGNVPQLPPTYMTRQTGLGGLVSGDLLILLVIGGLVYAVVK